MSQRISVLGTGYLSAIHAACMADLGHEVVAVDVDECKIAKLRKGQLPFFEPGLDEILTPNIEAVRLRFTSSYEEAAAWNPEFLREGFAVAVRRLDSRGVRRHRRGTAADGVGGVPEPPADLDQLVRRKAMIDGRNCLDPAEWRQAGWTYRSFGRP